MACFTRMRKQAQMLLCSHLNVEAVLNGAPALPRAHTPMSLSNLIIPRRHFAFEETK